MNGMLAHTLIWSGVLIALVLVLRRPVAKTFGPEAAYALWALPAVRLVLPPIILPAWMAPPAQVAAPDMPETAMVEQAAAAVPAVPFPADLAAAPPATGFDLFTLLADAPLVEGLLAETLLIVWLGGAGVFLWRRFAAYFDLRDHLLAEGREVGRIRLPLGHVRLVETTATLAPLAMGVLDRVIALPPGFMALHDRRARDLALAHELAHHRGGDLLVNVLVQPLFALHWFNPLARFGWLALRRDQEAACDARVMARRDAAERAAYAALIARFAAAPGATQYAVLTAPMACPVLGEKSIIHRLRSLSMTQLSPRRRMAGRVLLGAGLLALPLTASISYAASEAVLEASAPPEPPMPPAPPALTEAPEPPLPPEAPEAPEAPDVADRRSTMIIIEREMREVEREAREAEREARIAEHEAREVERELRETDLPRALEEARAASDHARAVSQRVIVKHECKPGSDEVAESTTASDGSQIVLICQTRVFATARKGLEEARTEIARDRAIPEDTRKRLLKQLVRQIARWSEQEG